MKKYFIYLAFSAMALSLSTSCEKSGDDNGKEDEKALNVRISAYAEVGDGWADNYVYTWDAEGRVSEINRNEGEKVWSFTYSGTTVNVDTPDGKVVLTLGSNGYVETMIDAWDEERTYTYNAAGQMVQAKKEGEVKSDITYADGCILTWTRYSDGELQTKEHTYLSVKNVAGIFNIKEETTDPTSQYWYLTGLFGKPSTYLAASSQWSHSEAKATYTYDYDENGCVIAEHKDYPDWPEEFTYSWEVIE